MGKLLRLIFILVVLGFVGLTGFAYLGDLSPHLDQVSRSVTLELE